MLKSKASKALEIPTADFVKFNASIFYDETIARE
jgi:hypothetical protein